MTRFEYLLIKSELSDKILDRFDESMSCWTFSDISEAAIPSSWITSETLYSLLTVQPDLLVDGRVRRGISFLEAEFIQEFVGGGWYSYKIWPKVMSEPTLWATRVLNKWSVKNNLILQGLTWLIANFNDDHGCGSYQGQISRTYNTAFTMICLLECRTNAAVLSSEGLADKVTQAINSAGNWLLTNYLRSEGGWAASRGGSYNPASTIHALLALEMLAEVNDDAERFLTKHCSEILENLFSRRDYAGGWPREVESFIVANGSQNFIQRSLWSPTMHGAVAVYRACKNFGFLNRYIAEIFETEKSILSMIKAGRRMPTFEMTQALWAISNISPELDGEYLNRHLPDLTSSSLIRIGKALYISLRLGVVISALFYSMAALAMWQPKPVGPLLLFLVACLSFLFLNAVHAYDIMGQSVIREKSITYLLYLLQAALLIYAGGEAFKSLLPGSNFAAFFFGDSVYNSFPFSGPRYKDHWEVHNQAIVTCRKHKHSVLNPTQTFISELTVE